METPTGDRVTETLELKRPTLRKLLEMAGYKFEGQASGFDRYTKTTHDGMLIETASVHVSLVELNVAEMTVSHGDEDVDDVSTLTDDATKRSGSGVDTSSSDGVDIVPISSGPTLPSSSPDEQGSVGLGEGKSGVIKTDNPS